MIGHVGKARDEPGRRQAADQALGRSCVAPCGRAVGQRDQTPSEAAQQVDARQPLPFPVRREQRGGLLRLDPAACRAPCRASAGRDRRRARARSCRAPPARSRRRDHGPSPRSRSSRAATASEGQPRGARDRATGTGGRASRRGARAGRAAAAARATRRPSVAAVGGVASRPIRALVARTTSGRARARGSTGSAARRARGAAPRRPSARAAAAGLAVWRIDSPEQRIVGEAAEELRVVVVEREHEAQPLDSTASLLGAHPHGAVRQLPGVHDLSVDHAREHAVAKRAAWRRTRASP